MTIPEKMAGLAPRRTASGMTQKELAEALGVERGTVSMWEIGKSWPPARLLPALADLLLCSIDELYTEPEEEETEGPPTPAERRARREHMQSRLF